MKNWIVTQWRRFVVRDIRRIGRPTNAQLQYEMGDIRLRLAKASDLFRGALVLEPKVEDMKRHVGLLHSRVSMLQYDINRATDKLKDLSAKLEQFSEEMVPSFEFEPGSTVEVSPACYEEMCRVLRIGERKAIEEFNLKLWEKAKENTKP